MDARDSALYADEGPAVCDARGLFETMRRATILTALLAVACSGETPRVFPPAAELPLREALPDPFVTFFGEERVESADDWQKVRRPELIELFEHYVYGVAPDAPAITARVETPDVEIAPGVVHRGVEITLSPDAPRIHLGLFLPAGVSDPPVLLALNPCGNQSLVESEAVRFTESFRALGCGAERGSRQERWPVFEIVGRGYALATFHESDVDPDDPDDERSLDGVHPHFDSGEGFRTAWGRLAAWAWGLSRAVDYLGTDTSVDATRIVVAGHSRRGKTALLAAALDERIAIAIPHQSGTGGASLSRDNTGESVGVITTLFPNWFDDVFATFADQEARLPVDQHLLITLVAPRPVLVTNGVEDLRADPMGALGAVRAAAPVYTLLGSRGLVLEDGRPSLDGPLSWHERTGGHSLEPRDWYTFMDFADRQW